jgi:transposase-like protein
MNELFTHLEKNINDILYYDKEKLAKEDEKKKENDPIESLMKTFFETILLAERNSYLNKERLAKTGNKANGYYERIAKAVNKYLKLRIPRDRHGLFKPLLLEAIKDKEVEMADMSLLLYGKGLTTRDIQDVFKRIYDKKLSPTSVSRITKEFEIERKAWQTRKLEKEYLFVYIDAIQIAVRRDTVQKEAFYTVIGVKKDMTREILSLENIPTESSTGWRKILQGIKKRGVEKVLMFIADGLAGVRNVVKEEFPKSNFQRCIFHKKKNILYEIRSSNKNEMATDLERVFVLENDKFTVEKGKRLLNGFLKKWGKRYPHLHRKFEEIDLESYFSYSKFPGKIQRMIYTTNWVERLNKKIRRTERIRNSFPNVDSALNLVGACLIDADRSFKTYPVTSFKPALEKLVQMLEDS